MMFVFFLLLDHALDSVRYCVYLLHHLIGCYCFGFVEGLIVLLGSGVHTVWAFWEIYSGTGWFERQVIILVGSWYIATIIGSIIAAILIPIWSKKRIYVRLCVFFY